MVIVDSTSHFTCTFTEEESIRVVLPTQQSSNTAAVVAVVGELVMGTLVGASVVGCLVGASVGAFVGTSVGALVGESVGTLVGASVGSLVGASVAAFVGTSVCALVGESVVAGQVVVGWAVVGSSEHFTPTGTGGFPTTVDTIFPASLNVHGGG